MKQAYIEKMAAQLKVWNAQINLLEAKAEHVGANMKLLHADTMLNLQHKQQMATEKLHAIENASSNAWENMKDTTHKIWDDLKAGIDDAHSKFK